MKNNIKVTIGIILYKDTKYLKWSLGSVLDQDYPHVEYIFRDQSPNGEVYDFLKQEHPEFFKKAKIEKGENLMHSGGNNVMIQHMLDNGGDIYICASNDMWYPKDFVSKIVDAMQKENAKVATCKLMQWDFEKVLKGDLEQSKTTVIDSLGISLTRSHKFFDQGQGMKESEFKGSHKIIGPSGALAVYHKDALEAIAYKNEEGKMEYFDALLHYKNDCDLAYRLSWAGFPCLMVDVKVYHDRQLGDKSGTGALEKLKEHHQKAYWAKESSLFGHLTTVKKNYSSDFSFDVKFRTWLSSVARWFYTVFLSPKMIPTYSKVSVLKGEIEKKRKVMKRKLSAKEMEGLMI